MRTIVGLLGLHGAGKTTMAAALGAAGYAVTLQPFTTREPRSGEGAEYAFLSQDEVRQRDVLWTYPKSECIYGLLASEADRVAEGKVGVVALHLEALPFIAKRFPGLDLALVGLDTIHSRDAQMARVGGIETRAQSEDQIAAGRQSIRSLPICLNGNADAVFGALVEFVKAR